MHDVLGYAQSDSRFSTSCTTIVNRCIDGAPNAIGTFHRVAENADALDRNTAYEPNYVPKVGDLIIYEETTWNYYYQKDSFYNAYIPGALGPEHIGIITHVAKKSTSNANTWHPNNNSYNYELNIVEGNYNECLDGRDLLSQNDYGEMVRLLGGEKHASTAHLTLDNQIKREFIYGYISPYYTTQYVRGDANGDGHVSITDLVTLKRYIMGDKEVIIDSENADIDKNNAVELTDLTSLSLYLLNGCSWKF